jgi:hypothetical protein
MRRLTGILLLLPFAAAAQTDTATPRQMYVVDSVLITSDTLEGVPPDQIAMITVASGKRTVEKYGEKAANGVIYIETKPFARKRYNRLFGSIAPAYAAALQKHGSDSTFQYIINDRPLSSNQENELAALEKGQITGIEILDARRLKQQFNIKDKQVGVLIRKSE